MRAAPTRPLSALRFSLTAWIVSTCLGLGACDARSPLAPKDMPKVAAQRARIVAPAGWDRDLLSILRPYLEPHEAAIVEQRFAATQVIELGWTPNVEAALAGVMPDLVVEWVRPNRATVVRPNASRDLNAADTSNIDALLPGGETGFGLTGEGVTLGEWDEGAPRVSHRELVGRVQVNDGAGPIAHSTEVAGTMIASGVSNDARGVAIGARLHAYDWNLDTLELYEHGAGLAATNHSYGGILGWDENSSCPDLRSWLGGAATEDAAFGKYMSDARALDSVAHARDVLLVWAAGNERQDGGPRSGQPHYHWPSCAGTYTDEHVVENETRFDTVGGQPTLKNGLVIGAVRDIVTDPPSADAILAEGYSSFGPMDDGRIKPDLVASGDDLYSSTTDADDAYSRSSGTSLATPVVTGALALLTQKYRQVNAQRDPRAAELKALVLHTAIDAGDEPGPDYERGFGLLDARAAAELLDAEATRSSASRQLQVGMAQASVTQTHTTAEEVAAGTPLRVTLAWLDPAGAANVGGIDDPTPALVNDVDVVLVAPDQQTLFYPWRLRANNPASAPTRSGPNRVDNVERIDVDAIDNVWTGRWSVRVTVQGALQSRGRAQAYGLASSEPLSVATVPVLGVPRTVAIEAPFGTAPALFSLPLTNLGGGVLDWSIAASVDWVTPSVSVGTAPSDVELSVDVSRFTAPGEHYASIEIDSSDPSGPRSVVVVLRLTCVPDCSGRQCGIDPVCGQSCGRCPDARACGASGTCVALANRCPAADLGSQLGVVAEGTTDTRATSTAGSCGGSSARDVLFRWTAPASGRFDFTTLGSDFDTVLYLRDGACDGAELACNDDSGGTASSASVELNAGQSVVVGVDGYGGSGHFVLTVSEGSCINHDLGSALGDAVLDASTVGSVNHLSGACGGADGEDVAVLWTAPADGEYRFTTAGSDADSDTVLYVLDGTCGGCALACADAPNPNSSTHAAETLLLELRRDQAVVVGIDSRNATDVGRVQLGITATADRCEGTCGGSPNGNCFCDAACLVAGDCCADACAACGHCDCVADCSGRTCGDDGCGGTCGGCSAGERCDAGACAVDPCDGVACPVCEACLEGACAALPELAPCDDGSSCTLGDRCVTGECVGAAIVCDDGNPCTTDVADEALGQCVFTAIGGCCNVVTDCADDDVCTLDICDPQSHLCRREDRDACCHTSADCDDTDPCTADSCTLGTCFNLVRSVCADEDAGVGTDAGWDQAQVHGGGCSCRIGTRTSRPMPGLVSALLVLAALLWRTRRSRARSTAAGTAPRSRRLR